ncbi:hypothetical protein TNCV_3603831 [Trichonephila clavipes]|nr:hypothetical protein TNCV_3603831 [Trichonephila clavipes]
MKTRAFKGTDLHYRDCLRCHHPQRNMDRFTDTELADMHVIYGLAEGNVRAAERLDHERYPQGDALDRWRERERFASQSV